MLASRTNCSFRHHIGTEPARASPYSGNDRRPHRPVEAPASGSVAHGIQRGANLRPCDALAQRTQYLTAHGMTVLAFFDSNWRQDSKQTLSRKHFESACHLNIFCNLAFVLSGGEADGGTL